jgi:AraC-like DNA-binding protein
MPRLTTTLLTTLLLRPLTLAGATLLPGQRRIVRRRQRTVPRITLQQTIVLINPLPQRGDLRQQAEHQLNRRLTTRPRDTLRIRNTHERKIPCALKESSRSPRPHVNAYHLTGYGSDAALSKAFRRELGQTPGGYRVASNHPPAIALTTA